MLSTLSLPLSLHAQEAARPTAAELLRFPAIKAFLAEGAGERHAQAQRVR